MMSPLEDLLVSTTEGILWRRILDFLSLNETYTALRCVSTTLRFATERYVFQSPAWHASFFNAPTKRSKKRNREEESKQPRRNYNNDNVRQGSILEHLLRQSTSNLLRLDLSRLHWFTGLSSETNTMSLLAIVFRQSPYLTTLNCSDCHRLSSDAVSLAMDPSLDLSNLKHMYLTNCYRVNGWNLHDMLTHPTLRLKTLHMGGCSAHIGVHLNNTTNSQDRRLLFNGNVESLDISGLEHLKGDLSDLSGLVQLRELFVQGCKGLAFSHYISEVLFSRIVASRLLETSDSDVDVSNLLEIRNEVVRELAAAIRPESFACLKILQWNDPMPRFTRMTALSLIALQGCQLVEVHLRGQESVRNEDIQVLTISCGKTLKVCDFQGLPYLEDSGLMTLGRHCTTLFDLDVSVCFRLSDVAFIELARQNCKLRCLRMEHLGVTNASLDAIARKLDHLRVLSIRGCHGIHNVSKLPTKLIDLDARDTNVFLDRNCLPIGLVYRNGRRQTLVRNSSSDALSPALPNTRHQCSFARQSKRFPTTLDDCQPMWSCQDCDMLPMRAICGQCVLQCHRGHRVEMVSLERFYCDCAVGLGKEPCKCI